MKHFDNPTRVVNCVNDFTISTYHTVLQHPVRCSEEVVRFIHNSNVIDGESTYQVVLYLDANYSIMAHSSWKSIENAIPEVMTRVVAENAFCLDAKSLVAVTLLKHSLQPAHLNHNMLLNLRLFGSLLRIPILDHVLILPDCWLSINQFGHTQVFNDRSL